MTDRDVDQNAVHTLRLCLNLQLDAMLLTLGATAAEQVNSNGATWAGWLAEDLDVTRTLARDVLAGGASLPGILGHQLHRDVPATRVEQLTDRYHALAELLEALSGREEQDPDSNLAQDARAAARHCRSRLEALRRLPVDGTPPPVGPSRTPQRYLPGELLG